MKKFLVLALMLIATPALAVELTINVPNQHAPRVLAALGYEYIVCNDVEGEEVCVDNPVSAKSYVTAKILDYLRTEVRIYEKRQAVSEIVDVELPVTEVE